jgi:uncharacterized repeat protein (TIGR01451 family)
MLLALADLMTTVTSSPSGNLLPNQPVTATVVMSNIGSSPAGNVVVYLQLPTGATAVTVSGGGSYNPATGLVTWPVIAFVPANTTPVATYTVTFVPPATGGQVRSDVNTPDVEVTLTNNPAVAQIGVIVVPEAPVPVPTVPWWMLAIALVGFAARTFRQRTPVR